MSDALIQEFFHEIERILTPNGNVMLWVDNTFTLDTSLQLVDMIVWNKGRIGLGYRSWRCSEYLVIFQKPPVRVKGVWPVRNIPDIWIE
jgi:site-specific DNA-methyltransferase (adenine-specific)